MSQCENKEFLKTLDDVLNDLADETKIELREDLSPQERAKRVSLILERKTRRPASFREAIEILFSESRFRQAILARLEELEISETIRKRGLLVDVEVAVLTKAASVLIQNAGKYYRKMTRAEAILEEYGELVGQVAADLQAAAGPFQPPKRQAEINALQSRIAAILKSSRVVPSSWLQVKTLAAAGGVLRELADLIGWNADNLSELIAQLSERSLSSRKLSWSGWISIHIRSLTKRIAEDHLAQGEVQLEPQARHDDEDEGRDAGGGFEQARENAPDDGLVLSDEHPEIGHAQYVASQEDVEFSTELRDGFVLISIPAEAAPYGVVRAEAKSHPPRGAAKIIGATLLALPHDPPDGCVRRGRVAVADLHPPQPANVRVSYAIVSATIRRGPDGRCVASDGFCAEEVRELLESPEVDGNDALKADICLFLDDLE